MKRSNAAERYYRKNMIAFLAISIPLTLLVFLIALPFYQEGFDYSKICLLPIAMAIVFTPVDIYYIVRYIQYRNISFINIHKGKVVDCESHNYGRYGTYVGFYVVLDDEYVEQRKILTKNCHSKADGYLGATVTVGQNPKNGEWIILE